MNNTNIPVTRVHSYNVSVAADVGINAAVIFYNICFWVEENAANERHFINGEYWTYNTVSAFQTIFPEMSYEQIRNAIRKLENNNYIKSAYLSDDALDRTKWYTVVDVEKWCSIPKCKCENSQMENAESTDDNILNNNINNISDNKQDAHENSTDNSHKKAFSKEKVSYKVFSSQNEEKMGEKHPPYNYNLEELETFIKGITYTLARKIEPDISDENINNISEIIVYFYVEYYKVMGRRHPILKDEVYARIISSIIDPPEPAYKSGYKYDVDVYKDMIENFFETDYGKCSGNRTDYKLPYFFSEKVFENLCWKGFYTGFADTGQYEEF